MATYIPGITDYIPQIQPFQPDLNFYANVLQTRQSRYDNAKTQLNSIYSSVLNSALSKEENIQRRDAFMKAINEDLKKISGLDLSLQQNADAAMGIFKGFYEDKYIADDMVKTKKYRSDMSRAEALRNCNDPTKCPGYWDEGVEAMQYRMEEYKKLSLDESLNYDIGGYDAYVPWKKEAIEKLEKMNYTVEQDRFSGNYIVHDKNGALVKQGLEGLIQEIYGDDPRIRSNYQTMSYVERKRAAKSGAPIYGNEEEAEKNYILKNLNEGLTQSKKQYALTKEAYAEVNSAILKFEDKKKKGTITQDELDALDIATRARDNLDGLSKQYEGDISEMEGTIQSDNIDLLRRKSDAAKVFTTRQSDINRIATYLSKRGEQHLIKPDEFKLISARGAESRATAGYQFNLDIKKESFKHDLGVKMEQLKSGLRISEMEKDYNFKYGLEELKKALNSGQVASGESGKGKKKSATGKEGLPIIGAPYTEVLQPSKSGTDVKIDLTENPTAIHDRDKEELAKYDNQSTKLNTAALYNFFQAAKGELAKNNNDVNKAFGAAKYLSLFGKNWNDIRSEEDFSKALTTFNKKSAATLLSDMIRLSKLSANPTGDNAWIRNYIDNNPEYIEKVKITQQTTESYNALMLNTNKQAAKKIKDSYNKDDADDYSFLADYLVTKNGIINNPETFAKHIRKFDPQIDDDDALDIYTDLLSKFYTNYNQLGGAKTNAGRGLDQETSEKYMIKSFGKEFIALDPAVKDETFMETMEGLKNISRDADTKITLGDASLDSFESYDENTQVALKDFINQLYNKSLRSTKETDDRPVFNATTYNIAAENENTGALTISNISPEFLKPYVGTEENPGPLYDVKDQLSNITLFYNNKTVDTPFKRGSEQSNFQTLLKTKKNYVVDSFDGFKISYNYINDDKIEVTNEYYKYDLDPSSPTFGQKIVPQPLQYELPISSVDNDLELALEASRKIQEENRAVEAAKFMAEKAKVKK